MTKSDIALVELAEKGAGGDIVRDLLATVSQLFMDFEIRNACGAEYGERSADRMNSRNGYRERRRQTRTGTVDLQIPKLRLFGKPGQPQSRHPHP